MPVFFVHDVNHGIVTPLDRKFRVREINPVQEVNATSKIHPKQETDTEDFKHQHAHQDLNASSEEGNQNKEPRQSSNEQSHKAIQAYQENIPPPKLSLGRVKDIMSHPVISIFQDQNLENAWRLMQQHEIHHLVILNEQYQYTGLLSEKLITPYFMHALKSHDKLRSADAIPLSEFCTQNLLSTHPETELADLGPAMLEYGLDAVAVSEHGKILGIVTKSDLFKVILQHEHFEVSV